MIEIIVDTRERRVIPFFTQIPPPPKITFSVQQINVGDYSINYNGYILFIIERKTWKDLASSMRDGRKNNVNKMIKVREETGCQLIYLIEGNPIPNPKTKFCRVPYKALRSHLDHLSYRDGIHIAHSKNQKNTVERIYEIIQNYLTIKPSPLLEIDKLEISYEKKGNEEKLKEKIEETPEAVIYKLWCCFPNITEKTASLFILKGYHISDLILGKISKDDIYSMTYENGYVIGKRSEKIWNGSRIKDINNKYFINMMFQIKGISKKTAQIIIDNISISELLMGNITADSISKIKKTTSRMVGMKISNDLLQYLVKRP
jgi:ERCC4-type nuclease